MKTNSKEIGLYYYKFNNFGDLLNENILEYFHIHYSQEEFISADLICLGSILDRLLSRGKISKANQNIQSQANQNKPIHVWGTGLMFYYADSPGEFIRPVVVHALRGEKTRQQVSDILGTPISCVLADPGLLASRIVRAKEKQYDIGLIPHYVDADNPVFQEMLNTYPNACIIDVQKPVEEVLSKISECRRIFSTSLHGLIAADSYGIPNCWCEASKKILGDGYKYHDYFSSFGTDRQPVWIESGNIPNPKEVCQTSYRFYREVKRKQRQLIKCFPSILSQ